MKKISFLYMALCIGLLTGCKKFIEAGPPENLLTEAQVFEKDVTANAAVLGLYQGISSSYAFTQSSEGISVLGGTSGDELRSYSTSLNRQQIYQNKIIPANSIISASWSAAYKFIYQSNIVIKGANASTTLSDKVKQELVGEALFLRAWLYFNLVNFYGDIPLILSTDYEINRVAPRVSQQLVYEQIIADLNNALALLPPGYRNANNADAETRIRVNKFAAYAMLARVYLYQSDYQKAEDMATKVIEQEQLYKLVPLDEVFSPGNQESIWELGPAGYMFTQEADNYILTRAPATSGGGGQKSNALTESLIQAFNPGDLRFSTWVGKVSSGGKDYYYPNKYKSGNGGLDIPENLKILRIAEQYLIRAEARAKLNKLTGSTAARLDLNAVRERTGLTDLSEQPLAQTLVAIEYERQVEFFCEGGHRWFDLKRWPTISGIPGSRLDEVMSLEASKKGSTWTATGALFPIPQSERLKNSSLTQNNGYEN